MAEAVLEVALENLSSLIQKELGLFLGFDQELRRLSSTLTAIKATLEDAEERQFTEKAIKDWLRKLKDAAYVLDDILDECATEALEMENGGFMCGLSDKVQSSCWLSSFHPKHVVFRRRIAKKMKRISERLDEIAEERSKFHLTEMVTHKKAEWRQTTSVIAQPQVYGRDEDKDKIVDFLVGDASSFEDLAVYPILGLGGLGKTTLAQIVFNHERVVNHFEQRIWVCVSEDFSMKRMTKAIIESASGHACEDLDLEPLQRKLIDLLQRKRYLLVLDDVWDDEQENWLRLKSVLIHGGKGASILVTTRLQKVAAIMGTIPPHELSMLSDDDCWELFKQRAFGPNEAELAELVVIGKEIVKKCGGVPLAAIAIGSLLRFKRKEKEWLYVKESTLWNLQGENFVMPALRLSYLNLPVKLRQCFAFCALFPKDEIISRQFLIELWMANGLISSSEMVDAEDIGDELFNELCWRSIFQDIETDEFGKITSFKMHDLVHDLAQYVAEEVCCSAVDNAIAEVSGRIRHLSIYVRNRPLKEVNSIQLVRVKSLKTCTIERCYPFGQLSSQVLKFNSLRMLNCKRLGRLPTSIGRLRYLRYLDISSGWFKSLPESLCMLLNLQILKLDNCGNLEKLPASLVRLKALQHLSLIGCHSLSRFPPQMGKLTCLRTLTMYFVGKEEGFQLAELGRLNLKGQLHIKQLEKVKSVIDAQEANMSSKHLSHLQLSWGRNEECQSQENVEQILEVLQPHTQQLQILAVEGYTGACFPQWMSSLSLKYLNSLELVDCKSCLNLPQLGKLPFLKYLSISNTSREIIYLYEESCADGIFLALESLILEKMPNLKNLSREDGESMFPHLSDLEIFECPQLLGLPSLPSINSLIIRGEGNPDLLSSIYKFRSLEQLYLGGNEELTCFPNGMLSNLSSLKRLHVFGCSKLEELLPNEVVNLGALQQLDIKHCQSLNSLTNGVLQGLHSLKKLVIVGSHKFNMSAGFQYLTCLEQLAIHGSSKIEGLQEALQHVTSLKTLILSDLPNLESLPAYLGNLVSLQLLAISKCPKLTCIPMSIQSLKKLGIYGCEELAKRCQAETGEDWSNIAHVQDIVIQNSGARFCMCGWGDEEHKAAALFKNDRPQELEDLYLHYALAQLV